MIEKVRASAHGEPRECLRVRVELDHELLAVGAEAEDEVAAEVVMRADAGRAIHRVLPHQLVRAQVRGGLVVARGFATVDEWHGRLRSRSSVGGELVYGRGQ